MSGHWIKLNDVHIRADRICGEKQDPHVIAGNLARLYDVPNAPIIDFDLLRIVATPTRNKKTPWLFTMEYRMRPFSPID